MGMVRKRFRRLRGQRGFSLVEILVSGMVLVVGLLSLSWMFASSASRVLESDIRSVLNQVAADEIETIRSLPYSAVGTEDGWPPGDIKDEEGRSVDGLDVWVVRQIVPVVDESDPRGDAAPASYKKVTISVAAVGHVGIDPVEVVTIIAGGSTGGNILVKVQDSEGNPLEGVNFTIINDVLVPPVSITSSAFVTGESGSMLVPGLTVDADGNYVVSASKAGYSSDSKSGVTVLQDTLQEVVLTIDLVASMTIHVIDETTGAELEGLGLTLSGPGDHPDSLTSQAGGVVVSDLRFSTSAEPYIVTLVAGTGYDMQQISVALPAGGHEDVTFYVIPGSATTTSTVVSTSTSTTSTTLSGTTTTLGTGGTLLVTVYRAGTTQRVRNAWVNLGGMTGYTNRSGEILFSDLPWTTYDIIVQANYYQDYTDTVTVSGASTLDVYLTYTGGGPGPH